LVDRDPSFELWATASSFGCLNLAFLEPRAQAALLRVLTMRCASELNGIIGNSRASGGSEEFVEARADGGLIENVGARNSTLEIVSPLILNR
jgi:hypothetical protein